MEDSERSAKIISQARQWNFEGDCSLLAWMQEISQNLEQRATATNDALQQLSIGVNRTAIALDNAANSLTALQYTQFVESRCHDDDEIVAKTPGVVPVETTNEKTVTSTEMMEIFLRKNLEMLHNSHEKYALDFDDSDEDEHATNCIYQPKNPYNDALLPHIYGSKLWKEHWHVGLCDGTNEYSGDEASDAFSESPSSSATDYESYESNTANLSEWASTSSIPIEHKHPAHMPTNNAPITSVPVFTQDKRLPKAQQLPSNDDSDTYSTTSRSTTTNPPITTRDHALFATLRHEPPSSSTSISSSHKYPAPPPVPLGQSQRNIAQASTMLPPPLIDAVPPTDIFADTTSAQQPNVNRVNASLQNQAMNTQSKRKPVNLFDDDDFNSFMTEADEQPQTKVDQPSSLPVPAARNLSTKKEQPTVTPKTIDLFAESLYENPSAANQTTVTASRTTAEPKEVKGRIPKNLFESRESSPPNDTLFTAEVERVQQKSSVVVQATRRSITAKSLFDDDEDDDDFLNVFGSKKLSLPQKTIGKTILFDDDESEGEDIISYTKQTARPTSNLFDNTPAFDEITSAVMLKKDEGIKPHDISVARENNSSSAVQNSSNDISKVDLFDNFEKEVATKSAAIPAERREEETASDPPAVKVTNKVFSSDLFNEDNTNDMLTEQPSNQETITTSIPKENFSQCVEPQNLSIKEIIQQKKPLFVDDFEDEDDDLFSQSLINEQTNEIVKDATINAAIKSNVYTENTQSSNKSTVSAFKRASVFANDHDDEHDDDLFGVKATQVVSKSGSGIHNQEEEMRDDFRSEKIDFLTSATNSSQETINTVRTEPIAKNHPELQLKKFDQTGIVALASETLFESNKTDPLFFQSQTTQKANATSKENDNCVEQHHQQEATVSKDESTHSTQHPKKNQADGNTILSTTIVETKTSILHANKNSAEFADINLDQAQNDNPEGPSESETISIPTATENAQSTSTRAIEAIGSLKYSGIFHDEPPDDDDFFTTLTSNSKQMSISKLTLDLENDFYEPALPAAPINATKTTNTASNTNTQNDGSNKPEPGSSDYGGLRLFSEIPPDDDGVEDFNFTVTSTKDSTEKSTINQRLPSVFYDDFSETLAAVQQMKENRKAVHGLFVDEPTADEQQFDIVEKATAQAQPQKPQTLQEKKVHQFANEKSAIVERDSEVEVETDKTGKLDIISASIKDEIDRAALHEAFESQPSAEKPRNSAGKLQMPNIKINVQALLPGGGPRPSSTETSKSFIDTRNEMPKLPVEQSKNSSKVSVISSTSSENLLPSICKSRVRVPAGRRPSTRRARQENYRQSLIADQNDFEDQDAGLESLAKSNSAIHPDKETDVEVAQPFSSKQTTEIVTSSDSHVAAISSQNTGNIKRPQTNLFVEDDDDNDDFLFSPLNTLSATNKQNAPLTLNNNIHAHTTKEQTTLPAQANKKNLTSFNKDFIEPNYGEADELFKSVRAAPINANQAKTATTTNTRNTAAASATIITKAAATTTTKAAPITTNTKSLFGTPEDSDDDLFKTSHSASAKTNPEKRLSRTTIATATKAVNVDAQPKTTTAISNKNKLDSIFGSDDEDDDDFLSNLKNKKKTTTKLLATSTSSGLFSDIDSDEDDLFGGKGRIKQAKENTLITPKTQLPAAKQQPTASKSLSAPNKPPTPLADNPLADLFNP
ncbi:WASH complex subunit 2 isoform X2 [Eurosta solidaginis]|uniref:WASH complex subunit 2 isoform X2 n=1 Tax=Eurosta solidaginis TaxID=178769 RepID=UPI003530F275